MAIKITKERKANLHFKELKKGMNDLWNQLLVPEAVFDAEKTFQVIKDYIFNYKRLLYSDISSNCFKLDDKLLESIEINILSLIDYSQTIDSVNDNEKEIIEKTQMTILKIYDHLCLITAQKAGLQKTDEDVQRIVNSNVTPFKEDLMKNMSSQLITLVGIFTAIAFVVFGGITSLSSVFSIIGESPISKIVMISSLWGIAISDCVFIFMYCIGKLTSNSLFEQISKAGIVAWSNLILLTIFFGSAWIYYINSRNISQWFVQFSETYPTAISIIGILIIIGLFIIGAVKIQKKTSSRD